MADQDFNYYWCDAPSPLHELIEKFKADKAAAFEQARKLAKEVGATNAVGRQRIEGFLFKKTPEVGSMWRVGGVGPDGRFYAPRKNIKAGRALAERMAAIRIPTAESLLREAKLWHMTFKGRYMHHSTIGWKDDRVFVVLPKTESMCNGKEKAIKEPPYLTECKKWEMDRWMDEGRPT